MEALCETTNECSAHFWSCQIPLIHVVTPPSSLSLTLQVQAASTDLQSDPDATLSPEDIIYMVTTPPRFGYLEIEPSPFNDERAGGGGGAALDKKRQPEIAPTSVLDGYPSSPFEVPLTLHHSASAQSPEGISLIHS